LEEWDNVPNKKVLELIEKGPKDNCVYFVNIRENYNIDAFKEMCKNTKCFCFTLLVRNPNIVTNEVPELIQQINNYYYDVIIDNDKDLNHLKLLAQNFIEDLSKSKF
jgi:tRNA uridine 5-carbamoylmethylation protein Kti12